MGNQPVQGKHLLATLEAEREGESPVYRHHSVADKPLVERADENIRTLYEAFLNGAKSFPDNRCLGYREGDSPYKWLSYKVVHTRALALGGGLVQLGLKPHQDRVGIYSANRVDWAITEIGSHAFSLTIVPLYDTLGPETVAYIIKQADLNTVVCSGEKIEKLVALSGTSLQRIISMDKPNEEQIGLAKEAGMQLLFIEEVEQSGLDNPLEADPPSSDELSTICYTSGTTGDPKGAMLTHGNFIADIAGAIVNGIDVGPSDVHISYLPLAHVFERLVMNTMWYKGGCCGFFRGDVRLLFDDITELRPTIFASVPRVWNRLYDKVMAGVKESGALKENVFHVAYASKQDGLKQGHLTSVFDIAFSTIRNKLGGNVRLMVTGSAPLSATVMEFLKICFSCPVIEGYGQTENSGAATMTLPDETILGTVGIPLPSVEIKLVDVPGLGYTAQDKPHPRGEICFRGPIVFKGYYANEEKTKEAIDEHGWLHSGDVGAILESGHLKIIDRVKNIFKLSHGEYVAPEKLELTYVQSSYVLQVFVHGETLKSSLIAVVVPDIDTLRPWAIEHGKEDDLEKLCADPEVNKMILADMTAVGKHNQLRGFEFVKAIHLSATPFSVDNDILTPTFKLKRPNAARAYQEELAELYKDLD